MHIDDVLKQPSDNGRRRLVRDDAEDEEPTPSVHHTEKVLATLARAPPFQVHCIVKPRSEKLEVAVEAV